VNNLGRPRRESSSSNPPSESKIDRDAITQRVLYVWVGLAAVVLLAIGVALFSSSPELSEPEPLTDVEDENVEGETTSQGGATLAESTVPVATTVRPSTDDPANSEDDSAVDEIGDESNDVSSTTSSTVINESLNGTESQVVNPGWIDTWSESAVRDHWDARQDAPSELEWVGSTSSCDPGSTSKGTKQAVLERVNWFRAMAGVSPTVVLNETKSESAQAAALVMAANNDLSHDITAGWLCYSESAAYGASNSNLHLGGGGVDAIDNYIEDFGASNLDVGHRRWVLSRGLSEIGTGDTYKSNALFVIGENADFEGATRRDDGAVLWPPEGYVPVDVIYPRWSVSIPNVSSIDISVEISIDGLRSTPQVFASTGRYGDEGAIIFEPGRVQAGQEVEVRVFALGELVFTYRVLPISVNG